MPSKNLSSRYASVPDPSTLPSTSSRSWPAIFLHLLALGSLTNSFHLLFSPSPMSDFMNGLYGGRWTFLTILGLGVSWLTFVVALLKDAFPSVKTFDLIKSWLMIIVVPAEGIISVLYWGLTAIDPTLLVPPESTFQISLGLDIGLHALPAIFLWTDFIVFSPPMSKKANPLAVSVLTVLAYTTWMEYTSSVNQRFPYPFLNEMTKSSRGAFYVAIIPLVLGLFHGANGIHGLLRGKDEHQGEADLVKKIE